MDRDRISNLPGEIRQHILSFLSVSEAIRTSVLSSTWRYVWIGLPSFDFGEEFWKNLQKSLASNHLHDRDRYWDHLSAERKTLSHQIDANDNLGRNDYSMKCNVIDDPDSISNVGALRYARILDRVVQILRANPRNETRKLHIYIPSVLGFGSSSISMDLVFTTGDELQGLRYYIQENKFRGDRNYLFNLPKYLLACSKSLGRLDIEQANSWCKMFETNMYKERMITEFPSLRKISMKSSVLDQLVVDNLLASCCTALEELEFSNCEGLKWLRLSGFPKLGVLKVEVVVGLNRAEINAPNLHTLHFKGLDASCYLNIASCRNLMKLHLKGLYITNDFFDDGLANFARLKSLNIRSCHKLTHIKVFSSFLADLHISRCSNLIELELDTPNLVSFSNAMSKKSNIMSLVCKTPIAPLKASLNLSPDDAINNTQWHPKVVELLANFSRSQEFILSWTANEGMIIPQDFRESSSPPLWGVQHLRVSLRLPSVLLTEHHFPQHLDTVLWLSPSSKSVSLAIPGLHLDKDSKKGGHEDQRLCPLWDISLKLQDEEGKDGCGCYPDQPIRCWRHSLRDMKINHPKRPEDVSIVKEFFHNALAN